MGVEPTEATSAVPSTSFEDWGRHRATTTPLAGLPVVGLVYGRTIYSGRSEPVGLPKRSRLVACPGWRSGFRGPPNARLESDSPCSR
jgi:hypothetical protein